MTIRAACMAAGAIALASVTLSGCADPPLPNTPQSVDSAYGIPARSVPAEYLRPDGTLWNGLMPAQPNG